MSQESISGRGPKGFDEVLIEAVDYGLEFVGRAGRELVYQVLESKYQVKQNEIPFKLEDFSRCLNSQFGSGGILLEKIIAKNLYRRLPEII